MVLQELEDVQIRKNMVCMQEREATLLVSFICGRRVKQNFLKIFNLYVFFEMALRYRKEE